MQNESRSSKHQQTQKHMSTIESIVIQRLFIIQFHFGQHFIIFIHKFKHIYLHIRVNFISEKAPKPPNQ